MVRRGLVAVAAVVGLVALAAPAGAAEYLPEQGLEYRFSEYYVGVNFIDGAVNALANCRNDADRMSGPAYVVTCTATVYGARMDVFQSV
jgi:hypothetical protein